MKILTLATLKGGVGKTTLTYTIGCYLAQKYKVLMIDADPQSNLTSNFGLDVFNDTLMTVADIFMHPEIDPQELLVYSPIESLPNLDLIPCTMMFYDMENYIYGLTDRERRFEEYKAMNKDFFESYDYILVDVHPGMNLVNQNVYNFVDEIILVTDPDANSARGTRLFVTTWANRKRPSMDLKVSGLIINNVERTSVTKALVEYFKDDELFSYITLKTTIPHTTAFKEAILEGIPIFKKKSSPGVANAKVALSNLVDEMFERGLL